MNTNNTEKEVRAETEGQVHMRSEQRGTVCTYKTKCKIYKTCVSI